MSSIVSSVVSPKALVVGAFAASLVALPASGLQASRPVAYLTNVPPEVCGSQGAYPGGTPCTQAEHKVTSSARDTAKAQRQAGLACPSGAGCSTARSNAQDAFNRQQQAIFQRQQLQAEDARRLKNK